MDGVEASILDPENMNTKQKSRCQTVNIENSPCQVKVCKKLTPCPAKDIKNSAAKGLNVFLNVILFPLSKDIDNLGKRYCVSKSSWVEKQQRTQAQQQQRKQ